jgi:hypothetical protein
MAGADASGQQSPGCKPPDMLGFLPMRGPLAHIAEVSVNSFAGNGQYIV